MQICTFEFKQIVNLKYFKFTINRISCCAKVTAIYNSKLLCFVDFVIFKNSKDLSILISLDRTMVMDAPLHNTIELKERFKKPF